MKPKGFELSTSIRWLLYLSLLFLLMSGIVWLVLHYFFMTETDFSTTPSPYESVALKIHGAAVPLFLIIFGTLFPAHMARAIKARKNMFTGISMLTVFILLILTGYLLYYTGSEIARDLSSLVHSVIGLMVVPFLVFHIARGKKAYSRTELSQH